MGIQATALSYKSRGDRTNILPRFSGQFASETIFITSSRALEHFTPYRKTARCIHGILFVVRWSSVFIGSSSRQSGISRHTKDADMVRMTMPSKMSKAVIAQNHSTGIVTKKRMDDCAVALPHRATHTVFRRQSNLCNRLCSSHGSSVHGQTS